MAQSGVLISSRYFTYMENPNVAWAWNQGAELVTNGDDMIGTIAWTTDDPDGWTVVETGATADVTEDAEGIQMLAESGVQVASIYQDISLDPKKEYIFKVEVETVTAGSLIALMGQAATDVAITGSMGMTFTAATNAFRIGKPDNHVNTGIAAIAMKTAATNVVVRTISVREMLQTWYPNGRRLHSITFWPGANADKCIFRDGYTTYAAQGNTTAPVCFYSYEATDLINTLGEVQYHGQRVKLILDTVNSTLSDGCKILIKWAE